MLNKQEQKAREICALCNWVQECKDCPHREWPSGVWHKEPRWDWKKCNEWKHYLENPIISKWRRFLCWIGLHKWYIFTSVKQPYVHRKCTRCGIEQEFICKNNYRITYWRYMSGKMK